MATVSQLAGGPAPTAWFRAGAEQWRHLAPVVVALRWARSDFIDPAMLIEWRRHHPTLAAWYSARHPRHRAP
uniref:hypothetical protein n=1 Tax=Amycolatopsis sp. CA-151526 TaxID=3239921 RepID=UPI003F4972D9